MDYDILVMAIGIVFASCILTTIIAWWAWFTVEKIGDSLLSMVAFFIPIIPILIGASYFILVS